MKKELVYFELNNWHCGLDYPPVEPFVSWMADDFNIVFSNEEWIKQNRLCVVADVIDMSQNFCITATREWVEKNCPLLLTEFTEFLRYPDEDDIVYGKWGHEFFKYEEDNIGCFWVELEDE